MQDSSRHHTRLPSKRNHGCIGVGHVAHGSHSVLHRCTCGAWWIESCETSCRAMCMPSRGGVLLPWQELRRSTLWVVSQPNTGLCLCMCKMMHVHSLCMATSVITKFFMWTMPKRHVQLLPNTVQHTAKHMQEWHFHTVQIMWNHIFTMHMLQPQWQKYK